MKIVMFNPNQKDIKDVIIKVDIHEFYIIGHVRMVDMNDFIKKL